MLSAIKVKAKIANFSVSRTETKKDGPMQKELAMFNDTNLQQGDLVKSRANKENRILAISETNSERKVESLYDQTIVNI